MSDTVDGRRARDADELLDTAPVGLLSFDDDGRITLVNRTLLDLLGHAPGELEGRSVESILTVAGRIFYQTHLFPLLRLSGLVEEVYVSLRARDGADVPVLLNAVHGLLSTDQQLKEVARSIRMSRSRQVCSIELPSAVPGILLGLRTSLAIAVIVAVVAEMLASSGGLGDELIQASRRFRSADVYAFVLVLGAIGATANGLLQHAERRILGRSLPPGAR